MELTLLSANSDEFPSTEFALEEPNGLLAVGGDLSCSRLIEAYRRGIFPWYEDGQPLLWWSPNPRTVLFPDRVHCSSSLRKHLRRSNWQVVIDRNFIGVMEHCSAPRAGSRGTWITEHMKQAYTSLHDLGVAHSVEVYEEHKLIGGLYGIALGGIFYGESMFSRKSNASKTALIYLARFLDQQGFALIDCQVASSHLFTLGAEEVSRPKFEAILQQRVTPIEIEKHKLTWQKAKNTVISNDGHCLD